MNSLPLSNQSFGSVYVVKGKNASDLRAVKNILIKSLLDTNPPNSNLKNFTDVIMLPAKDEECKLLVATNEDANLLKKFIKGVKDLYSIIEFEPKNAKENLNRILINTRFSEGAGNSGMKSYLSEAERFFVKFISSTGRKISDIKFTTSEKVTRANKLGRFNTVEGTLILDSKA